MHRFLFILLAFAQPAMAMEYQEELNQALWKELRNYSSSDAVSPSDNGDSLLNIVHLIHAGADALARNEKNISPLLFAARDNKLKPLEVFLHHAPDCIKKQEDITNGFLWAAHEGYSEICCALLGAGASNTAKNEDGETALICFAKKDTPSRSRICRLFLAHQKKHEACVIMYLHCLKEDSHSSSKRLYHFRKDLLRPYLEQYSVAGLLKAREKTGKRACDYAAFDWLNPDIKNNAHQIKEN